MRERQCLPRCPSGLPLPTAQIRHGWKSALRSVVDLPLLAFGADSALDFTRCNFLFLEASSIGCSAEPSGAFWVVRFRVGDVGGVGTSESESGFLPMNESSRNRSACWTLISALCFALNFLFAADDNSAPCFFAAAARTADWVATALDAAFRQVVHFLDV